MSADIASCEVNVNRHYSLIDEQQTDGWTDYLKKSKSTVYVVTTGMKVT